MDSTNQDRASDRWGHDDQHSNREEPDGGLSWIIMLFGILLMLAIGGTAFMVYRARQARELAAAQAALAEQVRQNELARQAAEKAMQEQKERSAK